MICLSFDTDHLDEERMREFVETVPVPGAGTFFCVQRYQVLEETPHERGPHALLEPGSDWDATLDRARAEFPDARGFRAHSAVQSHMLSLALKQRGYEYVSAADQIGRADIVPQREIWGIWQLPIYYMDIYDISLETHWGETGRRPFRRELRERAVEGDGLYVFAFHPVHLMLNSGSVADYESRRGRFLAGDPLEDLRCEGYGAGDYYNDLVELMQAERIGSTILAEVASHAAEAAAVGPGG